MTNKLPRQITARSSRSLIKRRVNPRTPAKRELTSPQSKLTPEIKQRLLIGHDNRVKCALRTNIRVMKIWKSLRPYALKVYYLFATGAHNFESRGAKSTEAKSEFGELFFNHSGRLVDKWHHYLPIYDRIFLPLRQKQESNSRDVIRFLEIGVYKGGSLELWRRFFGESAIIHGLDLDPACANLSTSDLPVHIGSQADERFLMDVVEKMGGIDIVLDDGSHQARHQRRSFDYLFPKLSEGGLYIIEDTSTSYWLAFGGGFRKPGTAIETAKSLVDGMHGWYHRIPSRRKSLAKYEIGAVHFYD